MGNRGKLLTLAVTVTMMVSAGVSVMRRTPSPLAPEDAASLDILPLADAAMVEAFGAELAEQLVSLSPQMDFDAIVARDQVALRSLSAGTLSERASFVRGVASGQSLHVLDVIYSSVLDGSRLRYLGSQTRSGLVVARYRLCHVGGGVDFYDLLFGVRDGETLIVDDFSLSEGRWQSESTAELFQAGVIERDYGRDELSNIRAFGHATRDERHEDVLRLYDALPASAQDLRAVWVQRITAGLATYGEERYLALLDEFAARFPNDPSAHSLLLDAHMLREEWLEARADIDALEALFPDPVWLTVRATLALEQGDPETSLAMAEQAVTADSSLEYAYDIGLQASLELGDLERANRFATALRDDFDEDLGLLAAEPGYERLVDLPVNAGSRR